MSKALKSAAVAVLVSAVLLPVASYAQQPSPAELQAQIAALLAQIRELQAQLAAQQGGGATWCYTFNKNLKIDDSGSGVAALREALRRENLTSPLGTGDEFDEMLASAVSEFQEKYKDDVLAPAGLTRGNGFVGKLTRKKLNSLYGCGVVVPPPPQPISLRLTSSLVPNDKGLNIVDYRATYDQSRKVVPDYITLQLSCPPGVTATILHEDSQRCGSAFRMDAAPGDYRVTLLFANSTLQTQVVGAMATAYSANGQRLASDKDAFGLAPAPVTPPSLPFVSVYSPNGGETLSFSSSSQITWGMTTDIAKVSVGLYKNDASYKWMVRDLPVSGTGGGITWAPSQYIPTSELAGGAVYKIYIIGYKADGTGTVEDKSNAPFSIVVSTAASPVISGVSGPTTLNAGQTGTWTVTASDPANGTLTYRVVWGDETSQANSAAAQSYIWTQTATFTHAYTTSGIYSPTFYVSNGLGGPDARASLSVNVGNAAQPSITVTSPNGGEQWQLNSQHTILWAPYDPTHGVNPAMTQVNAYLERYQNGSFVTVGKILPAGKASIHWIGEIGENGQYGNYAAPGDYYIRVVNSVTGASDRSDAPFKLVAQNTITANLLINGSHNNLTNVPVSGADYQVSWTSNAQTCAIYNYTATPYQQIDGLSPSGTRTLRLYSTSPASNSVTLSCTSQTPVEGNASDYIQVTGSPATITVTSPNGGEQWQLGSTHTILWTPYDPVNGINPAVTQVRAYLEKLVNGSYVTVGEAVEVGKASIHWAGDLNGYGSYPAPGDYYIRVVNSVTGASDRSDASFKLVAQNTITANLLINGSHNAVADVPASGANYQVSWSSNAQTCTIYVPRGHGQLDNLPATGTRTVMLYGSTTGYYVSLSCTSQTPVEGNASDYIEVRPSQPSITVTSPNGGEVWYPGEAHRITWRSTGMDTVRILLYRTKQDGALAIDYIDGGQSVAAANGYYDWTVPSLDRLVGGGGTNYWMRIENTSVNMSDTTDAPFSIVSGTTGAAYHPADTNRDWRISINEVTAYGRGQYFVSAMDIWRNGEAYRWDAGDNTWIPTTPNFMVQATDSDGSPDYRYATVTPNSYDLTTPGVGRGNYAGGGPAIFGLEPNPTTPKPTANSFSTYYDHCFNSSQLNEAFVQSDGRLGALGTAAPTGYVCSNGAFVAATSTQQPPTLQVSVGSDTPLGQQVLMGGTDFQLATFRFTETSNTEDIKITSLAVLDTASPTGAKSSFGNLKFYKSTDFTNPIATAGIATQTANGYAYTFNFAAPVVVPRSSSIGLVLKGDVSSYSSSGATDNSKHQFAVTAATTLGATSNASANVILSSPIGNVMTVLRTKLTIAAVALGATSGRMTTQTDDLATITFAADPAGALSLNQVKVTFSGTAPANPNFLSGVNLYDPATGMNMGTGNIAGGACGGTSTSGANCTSSETFMLGSGTNGYIISAGGSKTFNLRVNSLNIGGGGAGVAPTLSASIAAQDDILYTDGLDSGATSNIPLPPYATPLVFQSVSYAAGTGNPRMAAAIPGVPLRDQMASMVESLRAMVEELARAMGAR